MLTFTKLPGEANIVAVKGGPVSIAMRFKSSDITGKTYAAVVYENTDAGYAAAVAGNPAATLAVTVNDTNPGRLTVLVTKNQMAAFSAAKNYRWYLVETEASVDSPIVSGTFVARAP
jgi:hypothetical protein